MFKGMSNLKWIWWRGEQPQLAAKVVHRQLSEPMYGPNLTHLLESAAVSVIQAIRRQVYETSRREHPVTAMWQLGSTDNYAEPVCSVNKPAVPSLTPMDLSHGTVAFTLLHY